MARIVKKITVDVAETNRFAAIVAKQYDKSSRFLNIQLTNEEVPFSADLEATVVINARREDGVAKSFAGEVETDGTVTVPLAYWMLELDGTVMCDISLINGENMLTTCLFELAVQEAAADDEAISKDDDYGILITLIKEVRADADYLNRTAAQMRQEYEQSAQSMRTSYEASMQSAIDDCETAVAEVQLVTEPFFIKDRDSNKDYTAAIQIRNGKPVMVYEELLTT